MQPAKFAAYVERHATAAQLTEIRSRVTDGWHAFKICGTTARPLVLMARRNGIRSNIAPAADHLRVYPDGSAVRYEPRR